MSAVLLAVFRDFTAADRVRTALFFDGFPTDRVELTAECEPGRAALVPARSPRERFLQYFGMLFSGEDERSAAEHLAASIEHGAATITVHPRGPVEMARAAHILEHAGPAELMRHDLDNQALEHAAARQASPWIRAFWPEFTDEEHCIYCRLFEHHPH
jgi:hypothetical protein